MTRRDLASPSRPLVALLTDFGYDDIFVASMKVVVASMCPLASLLDITHSIPPHDIGAGVLALEGMAPLLPSGAVVVAVVDPGVGSHRRPLVVEREGRFYVGPDNGLLTPFLSGQAWWANRPRWWRPTVSRTFHGRDVFAPLAAHLANGVAPDELGDPITDPVRLSQPVVHRHGDWLEGEVVGIDRFGNAMTNILMEDVAPPAEVEAAGLRVALVEYYEQVEGGRLVALGNSLGYLELAIFRGRAADLPGLGLRAPVRVKVSS